VRVLLTSARRAGFAFEDAWDLAAEAALSYRSERAACDWWDVLDSTRDAWCDAFVGRPASLADLSC
jgi:hypothetical protein